MRYSQIKVIDMDAKINRVEHTGLCLVPPTPFKNLLRLVWKALKLT